MSIAPFEQSFAHGIYKQKYAHEGEEWSDTSVRVTQHVMGALHDAPNGHKVLWDSDSTERIYGLINDRRFIPGGRYLYATGREFHQTQNCLLLRAEDSREGWSDLQYKATMALMTGAGIGVYYGDVRPSNARIKKTGGVASGPVPLMKMVNETGRNVMQGGSRRSAIWAGLLWSHPDCESFIRAKDWPEWLREQKDKDFNTPAPLDMTNISVCLDDEFFEAYGDSSHPLHAHARKIYRKTVDKMVTTGEPGFSIDTGDAVNEKLRNACTEITSEDDSDICNLGSLVLPRFSTPEQFGAAVRDAVLFLTAGTLYSMVPYEKVGEIREKNRRLGLGLMGVHEFCLQHGTRYGTPESFEVLAPYAEEYARALEFAVDWQDKLGLSRSVAATAFAPNGTIGILAETTTSGEPILSAAYKRRVRNANPDADIVEYEYVVDPTAARLVEQGVDASIIEDAHSLSYDYERRFAMQEFLQRYTDHAISSTVNLPYQMTDPQEQSGFGDTLMKYLPNIRGVTCYPDGARAGQPITPVPLELALEKQGVRFEENEERCLGGACGV